MVSSSQSPLHAGEPHKHVAALLQVLDARKLQTPVQHVLAGDAHLQPPRAEALIDGAHVEQANIRVDAASETRGVAQAAIGFFGSVYCRRGCETASPRAPPRRRGPAGSSVSGVR